MYMKKLIAFIRDFTNKHGKHDMEVRGRSVRFNNYKESVRYLYYNPSSDQLILSDIYNPENIYINNVDWSYIGHL